MDILQKIDASMPEFSKGQKAIGKFILEHYDKAAYMTALKLGTTVRVSESTVVRFAIELGYDGYPDLQRSLRELIRTRLTSLQRIEITNDRIEEHEVLEKVMNLDIEKMKTTLDNIDKEAFDNAVNAIIGARNIYIMGMRSSACLAVFMNFYLSLIFGNVKLVNSTSRSEIFEQLFRIGEEDVIIGISFPRYSKRIIQGMELAKEQKAKTIAITDSKDSPLAEFADHTLLARSEMASFVDSLVAPLSVINAMIVAIGKKKQEDVLNTFNRLEDVWDKFDVYNKIEDNEDK